MVFPNPVAWRVVSADDYVVDPTGAKFVVAARTPSASHLPRVFPNDLGKVSGDATVVDCATGRRRPPVVSNLSVPRIDGVREVNGGRGATASGPE